MKTSITVVLALTFASGCYCSHRADRFTYEDGGVDAGDTDASPRPDAGRDGGSDAGVDAGDVPDAGECPGCALICVEGACVDGLTDLRAGFGHTCALRASGNVVCWGDNREGELGDGTMTPRATPTTVPVTGVASIDTSGRPWSCAVEVTGSVLCWGSNDRGALGTGAVSPAVIRTPGPVLGIADAVDVGAGSWHGCAVRATGAIVCWGFGAFGVLGNGDTEARLTPVAVATPTNADRVAAGGTFNCARQTNGSVLCWGSASSGATGQDPSGGNVLVPTAVPGITDAVDVTAGSSHVCALRPMGLGVHCWGDNGFGQLGVASPRTRPTPALIPGTEMAIDIDAGNNHTCAVLADGDVVCWGDNFEDQLGAEPSGGIGVVTVPGLPASVAVASGGAHTCAALATGGVMCWGRNMEGQLGNGSTSASEASPVAVVGLP